jgi:hypothetical protein
VTRVTDGAPVPGAILRRGVVTSAKAARSDAVAAAPKGYRGPPSDDQARVTSKADRRFAKQTHRPLGVAALDVRDANRELCQALPQHPLVGGTVFPRRLEHLVRGERQAPVEQLLGVGEGFGRCQFEIVRDTRDACTAGGKRSAKRVARARTSGSAGLVAITLGDTAIMAI